MPSQLRVRVFQYYLICSADKYSQYDRVFAVLAKGKEQAPVHQPAYLFTVPAAYYTFAYVAPIV
jgi:hypothetical protein